MDPDFAFCYQCEFFEFCERAADIYAPVCSEFIPAGSLNESEVSDL